MDDLKKDDSDRDRGRDRERSRRERPSRFSSSTRDRSPVRDRRKAGDRRVFVSNIAYESKWQDIKDLFRAEVGEVTFVELFKDETDKPRGCGIVEFETPELAAKAVERMHRFDLNGRKLVVKEDSGVTRDKCGNPISNRRGGGNDGEHVGSNRRDESRSNTWEGNNQLSSINSNIPSSSGVSSGSGGHSNSPQNKWGNTYGLSTSFLESLWINGPLLSKVFVANLDYKVDEKKLREVFKLAGKVIHAEISVDKEGKSRGFGVVEYDHPVEAVQAISMLHNQTLFDRRLTVRMDRQEKPDGPPKLPEGLKGIGLGLGTNGAVLQDVPRNLPSMQTPMAGLPTNVQQFQAAAVQAQVQASLGQPGLNAVNQGPLGHFTGSNTMAPNLTGVSGLLGQSLNVSDLANLSGANLSGANQPFGGQGALNPNQSMNAGLTGLNVNMASGLGVGGSGMGSNFTPMNNQNSILGGNSNFNNSGPGMGQGVGFGQRDFDSMSAALSVGPGGFSGFDRDNFRVINNQNNLRENNNFNGLGNLGNGRGNVPNPSNNTRLRDTIAVKNLPPNTHERELTQKFGEFGPILGIELQGKDAALIKFAREWDAERAVKVLDRTRYDGRTIDVLFY